MPMLLNAVDAPAEYTVESLQKDSIFLRPSSQWTDNSVRMKSFCFREVPPEFIRTKTCETDSSSALDFIMNIGNL